MVFGNKQNPQKRWPSEAWGCQSQLVSEAVVMWAMRGRGVGYGGGQEGLEEEAPHLVL